MFRKKFLNCIAHAFYIAFVVIVAVAELAELIPALCQALITDKWPKYAWWATRKLFSLPGNSRLNEWPLKLSYVSNT